MHSEKIEDARWFTEHVQPHEGALRAYLRSRFPTLHDTDDLVQEAYARLLRARCAGKVAYIKAYLFAVARNAALDLFRRSCVLPVGSLTDLDERTIPHDGPDAGDATSQRQEYEILATAMDALPARCREVIRLRFTEGLSYKEIGVRMSISAETVKVHMAKGMRRCTDRFRETGLLATHAEGGRSRS